MSISPIALGINPPQPTPGPLDQYGKVIGLQNLMQESQLRNQEIIQRQQQTADLHATTKAMLAWDPKKQSYDDLAQSVLQNGGSAAAAQTVQLHGQAIQKNAADVAKLDADTKA